MRGRRRRGLRRRRSPDCRRRPIAAGARGGGPSESAVRFEPSAASEVIARSEAPSESPPRLEPPVRSEVLARSQERPRPEPAAPDASAQPVKEAAAAAPPDVPVAPVLQRVARDPASPRVRQRLVPGRRPVDAPARELARAAADPEVTAVRTAAASVPPSPVVASPVVASPAVAFPGRGATQAATATFARAAARAPDRPCFGAASPVERDAVTPGPSARATPGAGAGARGTAAAVAAPPGAHEAQPTSAEHGNCGPADGLWRCA